MSISGTKNRYASPIVMALGLRDFSESVNMGPSIQGREEAFAAWSEPGATNISDLNNSQAWGGKEQRAARLY
jgi:hypothetical protein